jgi:hypothetical protein
LNPHDTLGEKHIIKFDDTSLGACLNYLRNPSAENLKKLVLKPGNKLAYSHHLWSSFFPNLTSEEFWSTQLSKVSWNEGLEHDVKAVRDYLLKQKERKWLREILRFLPKKHFFNTTVYLNLGYDHIVFGEDVALNLNSRQFNLDKRESVYYLIHELAHAGYVRYHPLPELRGIKTNRELLKVVKFLTHLEGMGVISALRLRVSEGGLLDNDYKILLNDRERTSRVSHYFRLISKLESNLDKEINEYRDQIFEEMSGRETRLWYITGCYMAQEIEKRQGIEALRNLVKQGSQEFFDTYRELAEAQ